MNTRTSSRATASRKLSKPAKGRACSTKTLSSMSRARTIPTIRYAPIWPRWAPFNFLLTLQQWHGAQRGQIGAYRIVGIVLARLILDSVFVEQALPFAGLLSFREAVALEDVLVFI